MVIAQILTLAGMTALLASRVRGEPSSPEAIEHEGIRYEAHARTLRAWDLGTNRLLWEKEAVGAEAHDGGIVALHAQDGWLVGAAESGRTFAFPL